MSGSYDSWTVRGRRPATLLGIVGLVGVVAAIGYFVSRSISQFANDESGVAEREVGRFQKADAESPPPEKLVDDDRKVLAPMTPGERVVVESLLTAFVQANVDPAIQIIVLDDTGHRGIQFAQKFAEVPISGPFKTEFGSGYQATSRPELLVDALFEKFQVQNATNVAVPNDLNIGRPVIVEQADLAYQRMPVVPPTHVRHPETTALFRFSRPAILPDRCLLYVSLHRGPLSGGQYFLVGQLVDGKWTLVETILYAFA